MPVVSDFNQIVGDAAVSVPATAGGAEFPLPDFNSGGRESGSTALLMCSLRNLTGSAEVRINANNVGSLTTAGANWVTQLVAVSGSSLNNGNNEIVLRNVSDGFQIKDVICFFHQAA